MNRHDDIQTLVAKVADLDYADYARMELEARRLRAEAMREQLGMVYRWLTTASRREDRKAEVGAQPHHA